MNYHLLNAENFFGSDGKPSTEYLSYYCQLPTTKKFIYSGYIPGTHYNELRFNKIVKVNLVTTRSLVNQFPDLEYTESISYYAQGIPDIGNLKSVDNFSLSFYYIFDKEKRYPVFDKYVKVIDENTLIINGKELNVNRQWDIGPAFYYSKTHKELFHSTNINFRYYREYIL